MKKSNFGTCRACGAPIMWIRTQSGKMTPVDIKTERFYPDPKGTKLYVMNDGRTMHGTPVPNGTDVMDAAPNVACGNISRFATCPQADRFRKRG